MFAQAQSGARPRGQDIEGRLSFYPPGAVQHDHEHPQAHVSMLLAGGFAEAMRGRDFDRFSGHDVRREAGERHAVRFGPSGALILTFEDKGRPPAQRLTPRPPAPTGYRATHIVASMDAVLGLLPARRTSVEGLPPSWLVSAREQLLDSPGGLSIESLARDRHVHRVHFARLFATHYGLSPSVFRLRSMVSHALALALSENLSLAEGALAAGFSDQAHLSRAVKAVCGLPTGALRRLLRPA